MGKIEKPVSIDTWDWHYRVGFDSSLHERVALCGDNLPLAQRAIFRQELDAYSAFVSLAQLLATVCDEDGDADAAIALAADGMLLHLPGFLAERYNARIAQCARLHGRQKASLHKLVERACATPFRSLHRDIFSPVFGGALTHLVAQAASEVEPMIAEEPVSRADLSGLAAQIVRQLKTGPAPRLASLSHALPTFSTTVTRGPGFAEYWPTSLSGAASNELIIYDNPDQLGMENFRATVAHEVLGHGTFYAAAERTPPPFFDHGAIALIEGWATWCEWTASKPAFARHLRSARCRGLSRFDARDAATIAHEIAADTRVMGYSPAVAESSIEYFFQYPGFAFSYTLGALWFEERLREQEPAQFLEWLTGQPWGNFFKTW